MNGIIALTKKKKSTEPVDSTPPEDRIRRKLIVNREEDPHQEPEPAGTLTSESENLDLWKNKCLLLTLPSRWYFVMGS